MDLIFGCRRAKEVHREAQIRNDADSQNDENDVARRLAQKSGFMSLKDRMRSLEEQEFKSQESRNKTLSNPTESVRSAPQFATLHELFSSSSRIHNNGPHNDHLGPKKPKIPVMKLSKDDWNVKCWEDRLDSYRRRRVGNRQHGINESEKPSRTNKPELQVAVFQGRIEDVASKLEKVREGAPLDEELHKLALNKKHESRMVSSHEWTDLLKSELTKGTHNPNTLRSMFAKHGEKKQDNTSRLVKSPLGRPIRKIFDDDDDDDGNDVRG